MYVLYVYPETDRIISPRCVLKRSSKNHASAALLLCVEEVVVVLGAVYVVGFLVALVGNRVGMGVGGC